MIDFSRKFLLGNQCEQCQDPCVTCKNLTSCLTCKEKFYLLNDQCVEKCPNGYYTNNKQCLQCNPICDTCIGKNEFFLRRKKVCVPFTGPSEDDCKSCVDGFSFDEKQKKCLSLCPNGNFYSKDDKVSIER